jgi:succinate dehydrogenase / fumarate reductase iron-sulfur subunit
MTQSAPVWTIHIRIKRQDAPGLPPRWEEFAVPHHPGLSITSCLQWITAHPVLSDGKPTTPPAWEADCLEETCGACSMLINGRAMPGCSTLVEKIGEADSPITLEPLSKFPVVRDLIVDRGRLLSDLQRVKAFVPIDGTFPVGPGPAMNRTVQEARQALSRCINCACCLEASSIRRGYSTNIRSAANSRPNALKL